MAPLTWRLAVVAGAVALLGLQLLLSQPEGQGAPLTASTGNAASRGASVDPWSPPGCVEIVGRPAFPQCEPCPPLSLGGPTTRCAFTRTPAIRFAPPALGFTGFHARRCPGLPAWALGTGDAMLVTRLCAYSAGE